MGQGPYEPAFLAAWSGGGVAEASGLGERLGEMHREGRLAWPEIEVEAADFARFIARVVPADVEPAAHLEGIQASDLYLVCGCRLGLERAAAAFQDYVAPVIRRAVRRVGSPNVEDLVQDLYRRLFLPEPGRPTKIERYAGHGSLRVWVGVVATRAALDDVRRGRPVSYADDALLERWAQVMQSTDLVHEKHALRAELKAAFADTLDALPTRDRNVLRYHLDGLTADQIARIYNVHRVTVARWMSRIRRTLYEGTRSGLTERIGAETRDVDSILRMADSALSLSVERLLKSPREGR